MPTERTEPRLRFRDAHDRGGMTAWDEGEASAYAGSSVAAHCTDGESEGVTVHAVLRNGIVVLLHLPPFVADALAADLTTAARATRRDATVQEAR